MSEHHSDMGAESHDVEEDRPMTEAYCNIWRSMQFMAPKWTSSKTYQCPGCYKSWYQPYQLIQHWCDSWCNANDICLVDQAWPQRIAHVCIDWRWKQERLRASDDTRVAEWRASIFTYDLQQ